MEIALPTLWSAVPAAAWLTVLLVIALAAATVTRPGRRATTEPIPRRRAEPIDGRRGRHPADERRRRPNADLHHDDALRLADELGRDDALRFADELGRDDALRFADELGRDDELRIDDELHPDDDLRYAGEVAVAADRAAVTAARLRADWERSQSDVDAAWSAYERADAEARRVAAASAFPLLRRRRAPGERAERERWLHRTATAACRRREISIGQLNDALAHRGWDARQHPVAQEVALRNAVREHRFAGYRAAAARERAAWERAERAAAALRSLRMETLAAGARAAQGVRSPAAPHWADQWATTQPLPVVTA